MLKQTMLNRFFGVSGVSILSVWMILGLLLLPSSEASAQDLDLAESVKSGTIFTDDLTGGVKTQSEKIPRRGTVISKSAREAMKADKSGTNVQGQSSGFTAYLNDEQVDAGGGPIELIGLNEDARVVLGDDEAPVGVALHVDFENNLFE